MAEIKVTVELTGTPCAVCGRLNTPRLQMTDTDTGRPAWFCWRHWWPRTVKRTLAGAR